MDCDHWGPLLWRGRCSPCDGFSRSHPVGSCAGCGRRGVAVRKQHCRGCWKHAAFLAGPLNTRVLFTAETTFDHQQLQLGGMYCPTPGGLGLRPVRPSAQATPSRAAGLEELVAGQLELPLAFTAARAVRTPGRRLRRPARPRPPRPLPPVPEHLHPVLGRIDQHAAAHGWSSQLRRRAQTTVRIVFTGAPAGYRTSFEELQQAGGPARLLRPLLVDLELMDQPPSARLDDLIADRTAGLPEGMRGDVAAWITHLHEGGSRSPAKTWKTVREYSRWVQPVLAAWARRYQHLRQVTAADVRRCLGELPARRQAYAYVGTRSLFGFCHRTHRVFANPTARMRWGGKARLPLLPLTEADHRRLAAHARTPMHRAVLVLAGVHGLRPVDIRHLVLTDIDLSAGQLHLAGGLRHPLGPISTEALSTWSDERRRRWPLTANPHLLLTDVSSTTTAPMSTTTLRQLFTGTGVTLDRIRRDRFLDELLTQGPDPLHLMAVFGTCSSTAMDYAQHAKRLLPPPL